MDSTMESGAQHLDQPGLAGTPGSGPQAAYDAIADWYEVWAGDSPGMIWAEGLLPEDLEGQRVLDVACGTGRLSRELARRGATVAGVDLSARMIEKAKAAGTPGPGCIDYTVADVTGWESWWDGAFFDGAVSDMALQDIADLPTTMAAIAAVLRNGAWFFASMVHPCFPGGENALPNWPPEGGYECEGWWISPDHGPDGVRFRVGAYHRRLSTYVNTMLDVGFTLERTIEPARGLPSMLIVACRKQGTRQRPAIGRSWEG